MNFLCLSFVVLYLQSSTKELRQSTEVEVIVQRIDRILFQTQESRQCLNNGASLMLHIDPDSYTTPISTLRDDLRFIFHILSLFKVFDQLSFWLLNSQVHVRKYIEFCFLECKTFLRKLHLFLAILRLDIRLILPFGYRLRRDRAWSLTKHLESRHVRPCEALGVTQ